MVDGSDMIQQEISIADQKGTQFDLEVGGEGDDDLVV